jgi:UDP-N-acetylmuramate dehydrogenase
VTVATEAALIELLSRVAESRPSLQILGLGSNLLISDEGQRGLTVRLGGDFKDFSVFGERVRAGAAVPLGQLARRMSKRGLGGLEALSGFPSTIGGAVVMNAGSYGTEIADLLIEVRVVERDGRRRVLTVDELEPSYRSTGLQRSGSIVTSATLQLHAVEAELALARIAELNLQRRRSMPGLPNAGSVFRNPPGDHAGRLLDEAGLKGHRLGRAEVSREHANVVVNLGGASAADVLALMVLMHRRVLESSGVSLQPEIVLCGAVRDQWRRRCGVATESSR